MVTKRQRKRFWNYTKNSYAPYRVKITAIEAREMAIDILKQAEADLRRERLAEMLFLDTICGVIDG